MQIFRDCTEVSEDFAEFSYFSSIAVCNGTNVYIMYKMSLCQPNCAIKRSAKKDLNILHISQPKSRTSPQIDCCSWCPSLFLITLSVRRDLGERASAISQPALDVPGPFSN